MAMPFYSGPKAEEVKAYREETGASMADAKRYLEKMWYRENMTKIMACTTEEKVQFLMELALKNKI